MNKVEVNEIEKQAEKTIKEKEELEYDVSSYLTKIFFFFLLATFGITIFKLEEKYFDCLSFLVLIGYICPLFQFLYKKKKLEYDEEYQTAKKVIEKYKKKQKKKN